VKPIEPMTQVRVFNTNLSRVLTIEVPVQDGRPLEHGDYSVPGVPGTGAKILIDFSDTAGAATGALLPTGRPVDRLDVPDVGEIDVSLVDIGNAHVFVRASDLGLRGTEGVAQLDADHDLRARLEHIRGAVVNENEVDLVSRLMFMQQTHKTYAGTSTVCTGVASRLAGTLVHEVTRLQMRQADTVRIGHPAGVIETETRVEKNEADEYVVRRATLGRTARRIMEGYVFVPEAPLPAPG
jgi:2-methylaconitate cis-trans-isomerase PrpF